MRKLKSASIIRRRRRPIGPQACDTRREGVIICDTLLKAENVRAQSALPVVHMEKCETLERSLTTNDKGYAKIGVGISI